MFFSDIIVGKWMPINILHREKQSASRFVHNYNADKD